MNKFGAQKVELDGHTFDSKSEANRYAHLKLWERGDTDAMRAIEAEPTPDYPGKASDDAWLKQDMEAQG